MARVNVAPVFAEKTHEGGPAARMTAEQALRRSVMSCMLWEREFYEDGEDIVARIQRLAGEVAPEVLADMAIEARRRMHLRHAPLMLLVALCKTGAGSRLVGDAIAGVISRADEPGELLAMYWKVNGADKPLSKQLKLGLAKALGKFDAYALAKYNRDAAVKLRDVLFLVHAKPKDEAQAGLWKKLAENALESPDTWEVALSGGADKKATWERLMREGMLGYLALLRNLRNMVEARVDEGLMREAILARKGAGRVLPFRYVAAARACPRMEPALDQALGAAIADLPPLPGMTAVLVDVSGSMDARLSAKSDMTRMDAAAALASVINAENLRVFTFSNVLVEIPPRRGMAGVDAVLRSQPHGGTLLGGAIDMIGRQVECDRLIVVTDEQSHDRVPEPKAGRAYMVNVASARNGVGYGGRWVHLDGWSENILRYIGAHEGR